MIVTFEATGLFAKPSPPLFLLAAGLTRDRQLNTIARWSSIRSVGIVERRGSKRAAYEVIGQPLSLLDDGASLHVPKLVDLLGKLLRAGRGD